ncbi:M1 family metallopeptidase [Nocardioides sp. SYSU DS0663]|uniref:M1 family metallopeptidase n=1 Tax=Nocardioides sp. SYSU DS0663 TaxID=3416445 RepID=UPI003F4B88A6
MSSRSRRLLAALAVSAAVLGIAPGGVPVAAAPVSPAPGERGIGDPYFPLDGNGGIDVRRYDVDVSYDFATRELRGTTRLRLRATADLSRFNLDLLLPVRAVRIDGRAVAWRKPGEHELQVTPDRPLRRGEVVTVLVRYAGNPAAIAWGGERNWLADAGEVVAMNQPHMAPWWFPANDHPRDKALMDVSVTVPRDKRVVGNGRLVSRRVHGARATTRWRASEPMAPYLAFFAAGRFQVADGVHEGLPWYVAVSRALPDAAQERAMALMRRTPAVVAWTERQLGPYPFESTGGVTTSLDPGFALENQTRPTYPSLDSASGLPTVVHEVAHQWFGNSVSVRGWRDIWLNEGPATFMEARYDETHGGVSASRWLDTNLGALADYDYFWRIRLDDPGADEIFSYPVYLRGGMALQALRQRVGEEDFWRLLRTWVRTHRGSVASTGQFHALAEQVSGEDLDGFFDAWLRARQAPERTAENGL